MSETQDNARPQTVALSFGSVVVDEWLGEDGPEESIYKAVELSNGRVIIMDDWGLIDQRDIDPSLPIPEQRFFYLSWDELLVALDAQRQEGFN